MEIFERLEAAFRGFGARDVIDIIILAAVVYISLIILKRNNALRLAKFVVILVIVCLVLASDIVGLGIARPILLAVPIVVIALIPMLFFPELRRQVLRLSSLREDKAKYDNRYGCTDEELKRAVAEIVRAVLNMAKKDCGALIVMVGDTIQPHIVESGTRLDAELSGLLLESIFNTHGPLHDGAVLIKGNKIMAAGCFLTLTQDLTVDKELGTRHRAGIGVTESNNVTAIIVSEETGIISIAQGGELKRYYDGAMLKAAVEEIYGLKAVGVKKRRRRKGL